MAEPGRRMQIPRMLVKWLGVHERGLSGQGHLLGVPCREMFLWCGNMSHVKVARREICRDVLELFDENQSCFGASVFILLARCDDTDSREVNSGIPWWPCISGYQFSG